MSVDDIIEEEIKGAARWCWFYWNLHQFLVVASIVLTLCVPVIMALSTLYTSMTTWINTAIVLLTGIAVILQVVDLTMSLGPRYRFVAQGYADLKVLQIKRQTGLIQDEDAAKELVRLTAKLPDQPAP
jgi:hypothetical protein